MSVKLADTLAPMGDFPAAMARDVNIAKGGDTEKSLQAMYDDGELGGGGAVQFIGTRAQWDALSDAEKEKYDGKEVVITNDTSSESVTIVTEWGETPSDSNVPSEKLVKDEFDSIEQVTSDVHCDIGNVRIGEVENATLGEHAHIMGFTSNSKSDPVIRYINYKEDGKSSKERLLLSYESSTEDLLIKGNANDKSTEFRLSNYAKKTDLDDKVDKVTGKGLSTNDYDDTEKAEVAKVKDKLSTSNVVTSFGTAASDSKVPSEKLVKDKFDNVAQELSGLADSIPTVNNATLTIQKNGTNVATFTANSSTTTTANITVPTVTDTYSATSTNAMSGKAVASALAGYLPITKLTGKTSYTIDPTDYHMILFDCVYQNVKHKSLIVVGANGRCEVSSGSDFTKITNTSNTSVTITGALTPASLTLICI